MPHDEKWPDESRRRHWGRAQLGASLTLIAIALGCVAYGLLFRAKPDGDAAARVAVERAAGKAVPSRERPPRSKGRPEAVRPHLALS